MLTERGKRWHAFSITMACVFLTAMLTGAVFSGIYQMWIWFGVFVAMSIYQAFLIAYVLRAQRRRTSNHPQGDDF